MANICDNVICIYGDEPELERLAKLYDQAVSEMKDGKKWRDYYNQYDIMFMLAGMPEEYVKGMTQCYFLDEPETKMKGETLFLQFVFSTKWHPAITEWDCFLKRCFPRLKFVYLAEETGNEIFINTDTDGIFFDERYYIDGAYRNSYIGEDDAIPNRYPTKKALLKAVSKWLGHTFHNICEVEEYFAEVEDSEAETWFNFYEYSEEAY